MVFSFFFFLLFFFDFISPFSAQRYIAWNSVISEKTFKSGVHYVEIRFDKTVRNNFKIIKIKIKKQKHTKNIFRMETFFTVLELLVTNFLIFFFFFFILQFYFKGKFGFDECVGSDEGTWSMGYDYRFDSMATQHKENVKFYYF